MSKNIKPISSRSYVNRLDACQCPVCLSTDIAADHIEPDGSIGTSNVQCQTCGSYWTEIWRVTGYDNLNENMNPVQLGEVLKKATEHKKSSIS